MKHSSKHMDAFADYIGAFDKDALTALFIGLLFAAVLAGLTIVQLCVYMTRFTHDHLFTRAKLLVLGALDIVIFILVAHATQFYTIETLWHNHHDALDIDVWSLKLEFVLTLILIPAVQTVYALQMWKVFIHRRIWLAAAAAAVAGSWVASLFSAARVANVYVLNIRSIGLTDALLAATVVQPVTDILLTTAICLFLRQARVRELGNESFIHTLIIYAIVSGLFTSVFHFSALILLVTDHYSAFLALQVMTSKIYINSMLAMMNYRNSLRQEQGSLTLPRFSERGSPDLGGKSRMRSPATTSTWNTSPADGKSRGPERPIDEKNRHADIATPIYMLRHMRPLPPLPTFTTES